MIVIVIPNVFIDAADEFTTTMVVTWYQLGTRKIGPTHTQTPKPQHVTPT